MAQRPADPAVTLVPLLALITFPSEIDGVAAGVGIVTAISVVWLVDWIKTPTIRHLGWRHVGDFYYFDFEIVGKVLPWWCGDPGTASVVLSWRSYSTFAKWDELPEPWNYEKGKFVPNLVPSTFYLPVTVQKPYSLPLIRLVEGETWVFSGWSYGWPRYGPDPVVGPNDPICVEVRGGSSLRWRRHVTVSRITNAGPGDRLPRRPDDFRDYLPQ